MIVLDTTVLAYAIGGEHPLRERCERLFDAVAAGRIAATTSPAVIQEFAHLRARRRGRHDAIAQAWHYTELLAPLLPLTENEVEPALRLFGVHPQLDAFDAFLAAGALAHGADAFVSADHAFAGIAGLRYVDPATAALDELVA